MSQSFTLRVSTPHPDPCVPRKVRDMYSIANDLMVAAVSDRISAFDVILPAHTIQGQVLNGIASYFLDAVSDIVPTWKVDTPHPQVTIGHACEPIRLEMVIRGYLTGHAWRTYKSGKRVLCGVPLTEGMKEHDRSSPLSHRQRKRKKATTKTSAKKTF